MEAAMTGAPAAAEGAEVQAEDAQVEQQQEAAPQWQDALQQVDHRLDSALDGIRDLAQLVNTRLPEQAQEDLPDFDQQYQEIFEANNGFVDPSQLQGLVQSQAQQIAAEAIAPIQQQLQAFQQQMTAQELAGLQTQFPELAEQRNAEALADQVVEAVNGILPPGVPPQIADGLMQNANFVRLVHLAEKARSRAQQETPAGQGQPVPQVETGGGAAPTTGAEEDEWAQIANAGRPQGRIW